MPFGMWLLFNRSFRKNLTDILGYDRKTAKNITNKAKPEYKEIIGKLPDGATVGVIKREGAWTYVEYYGKKGYVYSQYLSLD